MKKICKKCFAVLPLSEYNIAKKRPLRYTARCKSCIKIRNKRWRKKNQEHLKNYWKKYRIQNRSHLNKHRKEYNLINKSWINIRDTKQRNKNRIKINNRNKKWRDNNKDYMKQYIKNYTKTRRKNDILYNLSFNLRIRLYQILKSNKWSKNNTFKKYIGCSQEELKNHLEKQFQSNMSWGNYGMYGWHIDHIIPLSSAKTEEELYKLCHYTNLQPLWAFDNLTKGNKIYGITKKSL